MREILPAEENPVLREKAHEIPVKDIKSARIQNLIKEMKELLSREKYGVAMAAQQIGEPLALFIVSGRALAEREKDEDDPNEKIAPLLDQIYINPVMTKMSRGKTDKHEGCLSVRGMWGEVPRAEKATVKAYDEHGKAFTRGASGFLAHVFQHEMDHLNGILYTDKATKLYAEEQEPVGA